MNIILMGPPGAGKGTQSELIVKEFAVPHISTGDMFREAIAKGTELGKKAESFIKKGELVPDEVTISIVKERLSEDDCKKGYLLDGFPRTIIQAEALSKLTKEIGREVEFVINLKCDENELIKRIAGRRVCPTCGASFHILTKKPLEDDICDLCGAALIQRPDDNEVSLKVRLNAYTTKTFPLIEYYRNEGKLVEVEGLGTLNEVFSGVKKVLEGN